MCRGDAFLLYVPAAAEDQFLFSVFVNIDQYATEFAMAVNNIKFKSFLIDLAGISASPAGVYASTHIRDKFVFISFQLTEVSINV